MALLDALLQDGLETLEFFNCFLEGEGVVVEHEHLQPHQLVQEVPVVNVVLGTIVADQLPLLAT